MALTRPRTTKRPASAAPPAPVGHAGDFLPVEALGADGLLVRSDGAFVRYLEVTPTNPLVVDEEGVQRLTRGFTDMLLRVPGGMSVQLYAQANYVGLEKLLAAMRAETDGATAHLAASPERAQRAQAAALRRLAATHEEALALHAEDQAAVEVRFLLVVPMMPDRPTRQAGTIPLLRERQTSRSRKQRDPLTRDLHEHGLLARESRTLVDELRSALRAVDMQAEVLNGPQVADLLFGRLSPSVARTLPGLAPSRSAPEIFGALDEQTELDAAVQRARGLRDAVCHGALDLTDPRRVRIDGDLEHTLYVSRRPQRTFYGWLLHAMQSDRPWTLSVHVHMRDRGAMHDHYDRQERRLWGVNRSAETSGGRPNRDQQDQEAEFGAVKGELGGGGESIADVSIYQSIREPGPAPDPRALGDAVAVAMRRLSGPVEAAVSQGEVQQPDLWQSSLPLGLDVARRTFRTVTRNAADSVPFIATACGSPSGIPFAFAEPGRTVEFLNPFDRAHDNALTNIFAKSGRGKTFTSIQLISAAITRGAQANIIDRSKDHWKFLCDLIPGAVHLRLGLEDGGATINAWDVEDLANVPRAKIAFLVRLHALLVGDHDAGEDSYGLSASQRSLLAQAIRRTYQRAHELGLVARESTLRDVLFDLAAEEADNPAGSAEHAAIYRDLGMNVADCCDGGTYGYLFDRLTSIDAPEDAPLIVFNTAEAPEDEAVSAAVLFAAFEFVNARTERRYERYLQRYAEGWRPAGPFDGKSILVLEEVWKIVKRKATAAQVAEKARRGRHIGLWTVAITQNRSDLSGPNAKALLDNTTMHLNFGHDSADEIDLMARDMGLARSEAAQIKTLTREKGAYAQSYFINGSRGRGVVVMRPASHTYWTATSDPDDTPRRALAVQQAARARGRDSYAARWDALELLADPAWHQALLEQP